ncbi:hypothetical protein RMSM_04866 [Rhodopirellula maiorica SM1]|uniref:Uncharacterized protein n=1 Tax=Rhodopirellula maiorica SM1 TaxID=1265738 RepID=M5RFG5_9BACT|nr:hypothetical protein RMSM_04866 [Rhodopirellula maiorica SM1]
MNRCDVAAPEQDESLQWQVPMVAVLTLLLASVSCSSCLTNAL